MCTSDVGTPGCKLKKYSSTGEWLVTIGGTSGDNNLSGESARFYAPYQIVGNEIYGAYIDNSGSIIIDDDYGYKLKKYSSTGAWLATIGNGDTNSLNNSSAGSAGL
jgi:hypothetical protein